MVLFIQLVDPGLERPAVSGLVATATLMLTGIVIGRISSGETVAEAGVAGVVIFVLIALFLRAFRGFDVPGLAWFAGPFYAATFSMSAAWVGEMIQGTVEDAQEDQRVDWPWVFVSVICGFLLETYVLFLGEALFALTAVHLLPILLVSIFVTGWMVGFFSPGFTAIEPAIASIMMVILSVGVAEIWLLDPLPLPSVIAGTVGGLILGLAGGWLGEFTQSGPRALEIRRLIRGL
jgi:hypothetical protein